MSAPAVAADPWVTTSYCSACHRNHPGACGCARHRPAPVARDYWLAALKFYATGRTPRALRAMASNPEMTRGLALLSGVTEDEERAAMLAIARDIEELAAAGLTPEQAYFLASLDKVLGPYAENSALSAEVAA
jgi:hypothetical protein